MPNVSFAKKRATTIRYIHDPLILAFKISETLKIFYLCSISFSNLHEI